MRNTCLILLFFVLILSFFHLPVNAQTCVTFAGAEITTPHTPTTRTALLLQADGSYTAATISTTPPYGLLSLTPNFQNYIEACTPPPTTTGSLPTISVDPTAGAASQVIAWGYFTQGSGIPGAASTATEMPQNYVTVGLLSSSAGSLTEYPVPGGAATVATADFNGDGKPDLAVVWSGTATSGVAILLGKGDGTFASEVSYPTGTYSSDATIADFNGDGKLDLAVVGEGPGSLTILLGKGDGTFTTGSTITAGLSAIPLAVIAADLNGDSKLDLAIANGDGTVSVLLGNGDGTFGPAQTSPAGLNCEYLAAADFNKDGKLDLAVANSGAGLVSILLGNGDGTFGAPTQYSTTSDPTSLVITDFNHDGNLDVVTGTGTPGIITGNFGSGEIAVLLGNGDGTFQGGPLYTVPSPPYAIASADLNGDGKPDLVTANSSSNNMTILLNKGTGTFAASTYTLTSSSGSPIAPRGLALADLNGDGKIDIAAANYSGSASVSLGNGDGTFQPATFYPTGTSSTAVAAGDLNGDGKPDLVVANMGNLNDGGSDSGNVSILLGSGGGAFGTASNISAGTSPLQVALADFNGDGKLDLAVLDNGPFTSTGDVSVLIGKGDGTFQSPVSYTAGINPGAMAVGDVNGDGKPDLIVGTSDVNFNDLVYVYLGNGDGTFQNPISYPGQFGMSAIQIADMNGDGRPDLVIASCCGDTEMVYLLGNGDGTFQPQVLFNGGPSPWAIAVADFNGDGKPDLGIADQGSIGNNSTGYVTVLLNTTQSSSLEIKSATAGQVEPFAPESIVAAYGANLSVGTSEATSPLGTSLDGTTVTVTDSAGVPRPALLFYVSPTQINYEIPAGTAPGTATVTVTNKNGTTQTATIQIGSVSPGLFELNAAGLVAAWVLPIVSGVQQNLQPVYEISNNQVVGAPLNVTATNTTLYLEMYGTGIRDAKKVTVTVGGVDVTVLYASDAPGYAGEDQVNIGPLPLSLAGMGNVNIILMADGQAANTVTVNIQ
jgi:uncharacterized protein (TIGR03437 family)